MPAHSPRVTAFAASLLGLFLCAAARAEIRIFLPPANTYTTEGTIAVMGMVVGEESLKDRDSVTVQVNGGKPDAFKIREGWFFAGEVYLDTGLNSILVEKQSIQVMAGDDPRPPQGWNLSSGHVSIEDTCDGCHSAPQGAVADARKIVIPLLEPQETLCNWCHSQVSKPRRKEGITVHDPVRNGQCLRCHLPHAGSRPGLLRDEPKSLCRQCHQALMDDVASKPYVHGPLNVGDCSLCHARHSGPGDGLLNDPEITLCLKCHAASEVLSSNPAIDSHPGIKEGKCHDCHNSHASSNPRLMKKIVNNLCVECHPEKSHNFHEEKGFSIYICGRCHEVHRPDTISLIVHRSKELCESCHRDLGPGEFVHEALSEGGCFECHGFHGDPLGPRQATICGRCHPRDEDFATAHPVLLSEEVRCTTCHSPHRSPNRNLTHEVRHRPFAEKKCDACHQKDGSIIEADGGAEGICFTCHPEKKIPAEKPAGMIVHKPFSNAACSSCHLIHNSPHQYLLSTATLDLCGQCHSFVKKLKLLAPLSSHTSVMEGRCGDCHDSHIGSNAKLLKRPPEELCRSCHASLLEGVSVPHAPLEEGGCGDCHSGHTSRYPALLKDKEANLCRKCHGTLMRTFEATASGKVVHDPVQKGQCGKCHGIHGGSNAHLLKAPGNDLCRPCHPTFKKTSHHPYGGDYLTFTAAPLAGQQVRCDRCHRSHYSLNRSLIADRDDPLCKECHDF